MPRGKSSGPKPSKPASKRPIERYEHTGKQRINNPPVGLVTLETDPPLPTHRTYSYAQPVPSVPSRSPDKLWITILTSIPNWCGRGKRNIHLSKCRRFRCTCTSALIPAPSLTRCASATATDQPCSRLYLSAAKKIRRCARPLISIATPTAGRTASSPETPCW